MSAGRSANTWGLAAALCSILLTALAGCSDEERPRRPPGASGGSAGSGGTGGAGTGGSGGDAGSATGGSAGASGGSAGQAGDAGDAGAAGSGGDPGVCGDGQIGGAEECDGNDLGGKSCETYGFDTGSLSCNACSVVTSGCTGVEQCFDGRDNDGDVDIDCGDSDCAEPCAASCAAPPALSDPSLVSGNTISHPADHHLSCGIPSVPTGSEIAYRFVAERTGVLDVLLTTNERLGIDVRASCAEPSTALACTPSRRLITPINQGQTVFVVVDGIESTVSGAFTLDVRSRATQCGDGNRDPAEACDDGNTLAGDGCGSSCGLEASETEPNDDAGQADDFVNPFYGSIASANDADLVRVTLSRAASIVADVVDFGDKACEQRLLDSQLEILGTNGTSVLAFDDDAGVEFCSHAVLPTSPAGTYFVRVSAAGLAPFPYVLRISVDDCGNGTKSEGEQCDDGNNVAFDGCDPSCKLE